jgi:hypothetical protein
VTGAVDGTFEAFVAQRSTALLRTAYLLTGDAVVLVVLFSVL